MTIVLTKGSTTAKYVFYDVYVSAVRPGGGGGDAPLEEVVFNFGGVSYGTEADESAGTSVRDWSLSGPPG